MNAPALWVGGALLFWGWQTGLWQFAAPLAVVVEAARWLPVRLNLGARQFNRIWDLSASSWVLACVYLYNKYDVTAAVIMAVQWLPIFVYPLLAAQAYNVTSAINRGTFFWLLRRRARSFDSEPGLDVSLAYGVVCVLAASAANLRDLRFYLGVAALAAYAVMARRPRRVWMPVTAALFLFSAWMGYHAAAQIRIWQSHLESQTARWLYDWIAHDLEGDETYARIGGFESKKLSSRIVMKVEGEIPARPPDLLRQSVFNRYEAGTWYLVPRDFTRVPEDGMNSWTLLPQKKVRRSAVVSMALPRRRVALPLPLGTARISELPVAELERNGVGTIRIANGPETIQYRFNHGPGAAIDQPPEDVDLELPDRELPILRKIVAQLGLTNQPPDRALGTLLGWFQKNFTYTLDFPDQRLPSRRNSRQVIARFLTDARAGYCEHFATSAALLLRAAGIPSRYAVGYCVQESARSGESFIVRERHAHAWTLAYVNGRWMDFDTTPPVWDELDNARASLFRPISEWFSEMRFRFMLWRFEDHTGLPPRYLLLPLALLTGFIIWRLFARRRRTLIVRKKGKKSQAAWPGLDSEFYRIEARLRRMGLERHPGETLASWLQRVEKDVATATALRPLLELHYRLRFDPLSLTAEERAALAREARGWSP